MATDYAEKEREFLAGLEADTGHDLAGWMVLIDQQKLTHRNDIIDWLRTRGFHFSWASWLERIHHNGGRPIYVAAPAPPSGLAGASAPIASASAPLPAARPGPAATEPRAKVPGSLTPPASLQPASPALTEVLARAKAYRMLAEHLIREARRVVPGVEISAREGYVSLAHPAEFAALAVSARELRLGLELGEDAGESVVPKGRMSGTSASITHVGVLTDARQVNPSLLEALSQADRRVNGG